MSDLPDMPVTLGVEARERWSMTVVSVLAAGGIAALFLFALQASGRAQFFGAVALSFAIAGAAFLAGGLVGFLFGIPRVRQRSENGSGSNRDEGETVALYTPNTNLEQISDWLTKILVGVGLTQLATISTALDAIGEALGPGLIDIPASKPFAVAIILYFITAGFLVGYLLTSLYLGRALTEAERAHSLKKRLTRVEEQAEADVLALKLVGNQLAKGDGPRPAQSELDDALAHASGETRAHAYYRAEGLHDRSWRDASTRPLILHTIPVFRALIKSDINQQYDRNYGLLGYALINQPTPDYAEAEVALSTAIAIRGDDAETLEAYEANRAICRINLDPNFNAGESTEAVPKATIIRDLEVAASGEWTSDWVPDHPDVKKWLTLNKIDPESIFVPDDEEVA